MCMCKSDKSNAIVNMCVLGRMQNYILIHT